MSLVELFTDVDDFSQVFEPRWASFQLANGLRQRNRATQLSLSEIMTIMIYFHQSGYRFFKAYYQNHVQEHLAEEFPGLVSYSCFVTLMARALVPLVFYLLSKRGAHTGISFVDSTPLKVCHNKRIEKNKVFAGIAARGKTTMGWFYGFKLHLVVNAHGEILSFQLTPGNVDDRKPVPALFLGLFGKVFGDKGYISKDLLAKLLQANILLITGLRKNRKNQLMDLQDKLLLRKRSIIETINDQLKNISKIEHSRHRSFTNFLGNLLSGLITYSLQPIKPALNLTPALPAVVC